MTVSKPDKETIAPEEESFIGRWSRRKHEVHEEPVKVQETDTAADEVAKTPLLTDADMPPLESLGEDSDYTGFLSPRVSESLRKAALRKLFGSSGFNIRDGLDDYDGDYTEFEKLGDIITADMRHQMEMESRRHLEQLAEQESMEKDEQIDAATVSAELDETVDEEQKLDDIEIAQTVEQGDDAEVEL
jgi:hypothetical protein